MAPTNPLFAILITAVAFLSVWLINKNKPPMTEKGRFDSIDGLRGYLAFFVFLHHSDVNYVFVTTGEWTRTASNLYTVFGFGSVQVFFMITAFLFFSKLLNSNTSKMDWPKFFVGRLLRLYPLYLFSLSLILLVIIYLSRGNLYESYWELFKHITSWLLMGVFGNANINELKLTSQINAGVTWSLAYEWMFYLAMPIFAFLLRKKSTIFWLLFSLIGVALISSFNPLLGAKDFIGGILAAYLIRNEKFSVFATSKLASFIVTLCLVVVVFLNITGNEDITLTLLAVAFILIACGNNLYGALAHSTSKALGDLSYSIYLLHGILLFVIFNIVLDKSFITSPNTYWAIIALITPILIFACHFTYHYIEYPAMRSTNYTMDWLKKLSRRNVQKA